jgi:type IV pilus assembly protein PilA
MKKFLSKFSKQSRGEKGFTLIELLIVIAVLGILAAVIIPNVTGFIISGRVAAANSEVASLQTAAQGYIAENSGIGTATTINTAAGTDLAIAPYLAGSVKYAYTITYAGGLFTLTGTPTVAGLVGGAKADTDGLKWVATPGQWARK